MIGKKTANIVEKTLPKNSFLVNNQTQFAASEAFKSVRTNLLSLLAKYEDKPKQLCFTSPQAGDGKTLNCANVAASFAEMSAKVLIIDADMRNPKLHNYFNIPVSPGLSDCLNGSSDFTSAIVAYPNIPGLFILTSGKIPTNPTELILSNQFTDLLKALEQDFQYVFIDAPPACVVTDATIISQKTLGAILVCKSGKTKIDLAKKAKQEIEQGGGIILGSILNSVSTKKESF